MSRFVLLIAWIRIICLSVSFPPSTALGSVWNICNTGTTFITRSSYSGVNFKGSIIINSTMYNINSPATFMSDKEHDDIIFSCACDITAIDGSSFDISYGRDQYSKLEISDNCMVPSKGMACSDALVIDSHSRTDTRREIYNNTNKWMLPSFSVSFMEEVCRISVTYERNIRQVPGVELLWLEILASQKLKLNCSKSLTIVKIASDMSTLASGTFARKTNGHDDEIHRSTFASIVDSDDDNIHSSTLVSKTTRREDKISSFTASKTTANSEINRSENIVTNYVSASKTKKSEDENYNTTFLAILCTVLLVAFVIILVVIGYTAWRHRHPVYYNQSGHTRLSVRESSSETASTSMTRHSVPDDRYVPLETMREIKRREEWRTAPPRINNDFTVSFDQTEAEYQDPEDPLSDPSLSQESQPVQNPNGNSKKLQGNKSQKDYYNVPEDDGYQSISSTCTTSVDNSKALDGVNNCEIHLPISVTNDESDSDGTSVEENSVTESDQEEDITILNNEESPLQSSSEPHALLVQNVDEYGEIWESTA